MVSWRRKRALVPGLVLGTLLGPVTAQALGQGPVVEPGPVPQSLVPAPPTPAVQGPVPATVTPACEAAPRAPLGQDFKQYLQDCFLGYAEEFMAPPLGSSVATHFGAHVAQAQAARMVLYHYDFFDSSPALNPRGKDQLVKLVSQLPTNFLPLIIEATPYEPGLDEARRVAVIKMLAGFAFPIPSERVVIGPALAVGLSGREAERTYINLLTQPLRSSSSGTGFGAVGGSNQGGGLFGQPPTGVPPNP